MNQLKNKIETLSVYYYLRKLVIDDILKIRMLRLGKNKNGSHNIKFLFNKINILKERYFFIIEIIEEYRIKVIIKTNHNTPFVKEFNNEESFILFIKILYDLL
jgi:hypothetical protein